MLVADYCTILFRQNLLDTCMQDMHKAYEIVQSVPEIMTSSTVVVIMML